MMWSCGTIWFSAVREAPEVRGAEQHSDEVLPVLYADDRRYVTTRQIGKGSTANIYLAVDPEGRQVALKVLKADSAVRPRAFMREADRLQALRRKERELFPDRDHSAFPEVRDRDPGERFFVAEVAQGRPLSRVFSHRQIMRPDQAVAVAIAIGEALQVVSALGLRNRDLKSDAIFWNPATGRVVVVDWNAVGQAQRGDHVWLSTDVRVTASYLDALLAGGEHTAEWSAPFTTPPARWAEYYRALRLALEDLLRFPGEADLDGFLSTLRAVESMLSDRPDQLLDFVTQCLLDARAETSDEGRTGLAEQALAAVEIGMQTDHGPTRMRGVALQGQAEDIQREGDVIVQLWNAISAEESDASFEAGETLEALRLRALAAFVRRAPGYVDEAYSIARHFARLEWQLALAVITSLTKRLEPHSELETLLKGLEAEARGLSGAYVALETMESGEPGRARTLLADGLAALAGSRYGELLLTRFGHLRTLFDHLEPAEPVSRVDDIDVGLAVLRRQFAVDGSVDPAALQALGEGDATRVFSELIRAWDEVDQSGSKETGESLVSALVYALKMSAGQRGSVPLARSLPALGRAATGFEGRIGGVNLEEARSAATDAENLRDALAALGDAIADTDLPESWQVEAKPYVQGWLARSTNLVERTQEALQSLTLYRKGLAELGDDPPLAQRVELLLRLERRRPEDRTIGDLLMGARRRVEEGLRTGKPSEDLLTARRLLFPKTAVERPAPPPPPTQVRAEPTPSSRPVSPRPPGPVVTSARRTHSRRPGDTSWVSVSVLAAASVIVLAFHWAANRAPADRAAERGLSVPQASSKMPPASSKTLPPAATRSGPASPSMAKTRPQPPASAKPAVVDAPPPVPAPSKAVARPPAISRTTPSTLDVQPIPQPAASTPRSRVESAENTVGTPPIRTVSPAASSATDPVASPSAPPSRVTPPKARPVPSNKVAPKPRPRRTAKPVRTAPRERTRTAKSPVKPRRFATTAKDRAAIRMAQERARALREKLGRGKATAPKPPAKTPNKQRPKATEPRPPKASKPPEKSTASPGYLTDDW